MEVLDGFEMVLCPVCNKYRMMDGREDLKYDCRKNEEFSLDNKAEFTIKCKYCKHIIGFKKVS